MDANPIVSSHNWRQSCTCSTSVQNPPECAFQWEVLTWLTNYDLVQIRLVTSENSTGDDRKSVKGLPSKFIVFLGENINIVGEKINITDLNLCLKVRLIDNLLNQLCIQASAEHQFLSLIAIKETYWFGFVLKTLRAEVRALSAVPSWTSLLSILLNEIHFTGLDTAEKVEAMFDGIAYDKGGSVLRMLRAYLDRNMDPAPLLRRSLLQVWLLFVNNYSTLDSMSCPNLACCPMGACCCKALTVAYKYYRVERCNCSQWILWGERAAKRMIALQTNIYVHTYNIANPGTHIYRILYCCLLLSFHTRQSGK